MLCLSIVYRNASPTRPHEVRVCWVMKPTGSVGLGVVVKKSSYTQ